MNYESIKELAKEQGVSVENLIALSPTHDPFYVGSKSEVAMAHWFAELWARFGYVSGVHLRRIHYRIVSNDEPIAQPNGRPYENTYDCYLYLCRAGMYARYLNLVDVAAFEDHRTPDAIVNAHWRNPGDGDYRNPTPGYGLYPLDDWSPELPELPELEGLPEDLPELPCLGYLGYDDGEGHSLVQQPYHVEVWCEKTTMNDVLEPICRRYNVNLVTGAGHMSITAVWDFLKRVRGAQRPACILYVSDYDPAGLDMPIGVARKVEFYQSKGDGDLDIRLQPIVLTAGQVAQYDLPQMPVKETRKAGWQADGVTELDALEAIHPGLLGQIVEDAILNYYDPDLDQKVIAQRRKLGLRLIEETRKLSTSKRNELDDIGADYSDLVGEMEGLRERFAELVKPFQSEIDAYQERLDNLKERWGWLQLGIVGELEQVDIDLDEYALPEPKLPEEPGDLLYDSGRAYLEQLGYYKAHRGGAV